MNKKIKNKRKGLWMAALLLVTVITGAVDMSRIVWGSRTEGKTPCIRQTAMWTEQETGKAELDIELEGFSEWLEERYPEDGDVADGSEDVREGLEKETEERTKKSEEVEKPEEVEETEEAEATEEIGGKEEVEKPEEMETEDAERLERTEELEKSENSEETEAAQVMPEAEKVSENQEHLSRQEEAEKKEDLSTENETEPETTDEEISDTVEPEELELSYEEEPELFEDGSKAADTEKLYPQEEKEPQILSRPSELKVTVMLSRYFKADLEKLPDNCRVEEISWKDQKGREQISEKMMLTIKTGEISERSEPMAIPVILKEEYRYPIQAMQYILTESENISNQEDSCGTCLCMEEADGTYILKSEDAPALEVEAAKADMTVSLFTESSLMKAGETLKYRVEVENTGHTELEQIKLISDFSCPKIRQSWMEAEDFESDGNRGTLAGLKPGEKRSFYVLAPLEDQQENDLTHTVKVAGSVSGREEILERKVSVVGKLVPLKADFTVKKTADRDSVRPGDKVTYQICIINTGEKTLHSVVGTEQFRQEGVYARFMDDRGIRLSQDKTKAYIDKIEPGEAISLRAQVVIPEKTVNSRLLNRVTVTSLETGSRQVSASSEISVKKDYLSPTLAPAFSGIPDSTQMTGNDSNGTEESGSLAVSASTHPKTGDDTETGGYFFLLAIAVTAGMGAAWLLVNYRRMKH